MTKKKLADIVTDLLRGGENTACLLRRNSIDEQGAQECLTNFETQSSTASHLSSSAGSDDNALERN